MPLEAARPELGRGGRGLAEGAEDEARGEAARGVDGEAGRGRGREAPDEGLHLGCGWRGVIGTRAEEEHGELRRGMGRLRGAVALVLGLVLGLAVVVVVAVVAMAVRRRRGPIRRAEGTGVLRSAHGCGGDGEGGGAGSKGLGEVLERRRGERRLGICRFGVEGRSPRWETSRVRSSIQNGALIMDV